MRKNFFPAILFSCLLTACFTIYEEITPQQQLGIDLATSIKQGDKEQFKKLFSQNQLRQLIDDGLENNFVTYQQFFFDRYGNYQLSDFSFNFQGASNSGKLYFFFKGKRKGEKDIVWENGRWVFSEF